MSVFFIFTELHRGFITKNNPLRSISAKPIMLRWTTEGPGYHPGRGSEEGGLIPSTLGSKSINTEALFRKGLLFLEKTKILWCVVTSALFLEVSSLNKPFSEAS